MTDVRRSGFVWILLLTLSPAAVLGEDVPRLGYVYPAGGRRGTRLRVLIGGQHLDEARSVMISGDGVRAEMVEHIRPLNQGQFKEMQNRMGLLMKQKGDDERGGRRGRRRNKPAPEKQAEPWTPEKQEELDRLRRILSTFSIRRTSVPALVETLSFDVTIDADAQPGRRELRLLTDEGLSNPMVFCIGRLPEIVETSGRTMALEQSQKRGGRGRKKQADNRPEPGTTPVKDTTRDEVEVALPVIVNGQILPGDVDRYAFRAEKGQCLVVDVNARSLIPFFADGVPGWFQAMVRLYDNEGHLVATGETFGHRHDPVLHCDIPAEGRYVLEIADTLFRGREDFVYRVALGELPMVTSVFPMGARVGRQTVVRLRGWNLRENALTRTFDKPGVHTLAVPGIVPGDVPFAVDTLDEKAEVEPNGTATDAQSVAWPLVVNGCIDGPGDIDRFMIRARKGETIVAKVQARRLGGPLDSLLMLTDRQGRLLAANDDHHDPADGLTTHHADSHLVATVPADGDYLLSIVDTQGHGGRAYGYRLRISHPRPDYQLRVVPASISARAGTTVPIAVHVLRRDGFDGPVNLALAGAPGGFTLAGTRVPAGVNKLRLTLTVPDKADDAVQELSLVGRARVDGREVTREAVPADDLMQAFVYRHLVVAKRWQVAVTGKARRSTLGVDRVGPLKLPAGGSVRVEVNVPRHIRFGEVRLELSDPPEGIVLDCTRLQEDGILAFRAEAAVAKPGVAGNLIVNAYAVKTKENTGKGKEQRKKRRILLGVLPAIAFEVIPEQPGEQPAH